MHSVKLQRYLSIAWALAAICLGQNPAAEAKIKLEANGYSIYIFQDGSGIIKTNNAAPLSEDADIPSGTVDFAVLKAAVEAEIAKPPTYPRPKILVGAGVRPAGENGMTIEPIENIDVWNNLIDQVEPSLGGPWLKEFTKVVKKRPLKIAKP